MVKSFLIALLLLSHSVLGSAQTKATQVFSDYAFNQKEVQYFITTYPELENTEVAAITKTEVGQSQLSLKLYAENSNDAYVLSKSPVKTEIEKMNVPFDVGQKLFEGEIHGSLYETLVEDIKNEKIAQQISEAFKEEFTTTKSMKVKATYSFLVIEYLDNGQQIKLGNVTKARLQVGSAISERVLQQDLETLKWSLLPIRPENNDRPFYAPVRKSRVSSLFNLARKHPLKRRIQPHNGIDFVASAGTPVYPALEGVIIGKGRARAKGKFILIEHDNGYRTTYDHLRRFAKGLKVGMRVELEDKIGEVGRTGYATGAHLHFGVMKDGLCLNPLYLVKDYTFEQKDQFENTDTADYDAIAPLDEQMESGE